MQTKAKQVFAVVLAMAMLLTLLGGCGNKEMETYKNDSIAAIEAMGEKMTALQTAIGSFDGTDATLKGVNEALADCRTSCQAIIDLPAPAKAKDVHAKLTEAMNDVMAGMDIFAEVFVSIESIQAADESKLTEGQNLMTQGATKLMEAATEMDKL